MYYHLTFAFSWTPLGNIYTSIGFQPVIFLILIFFVVNNSKQVGVLIGSIKSRSDEEISDSEKHLIQKYRAKLQYKNLETLQTIVEQPNDYQKEYVFCRKGTNK